MGAFDDLPGEFDSFSDLPDREPSSALRRVGGDTGLSLLKGAIGVPEAAVGLADIVSGGRAGKIAEDVGFRPKEARAFLDQYYTPEQQAANRRVQEAEGFFPTTLEALKNPSTIGHAVAESLPLVGGGGVIARALARLGTRPLIAGAAGEGVVSGGLTAEQVRQESPTGLITPEQSAIAAGSGALTSVFVAGGGALARKLKIADIDTLIAGGKLPPGASSKGFARRLVEGGITEGVFEELPQSAQEQLLQNYALGKPIMEGVAESAAMGMLAGGVMGGGTSLLFNSRPTEPVPDPLLNPRDKGLRDVADIATGTERARERAQAAAESAQEGATTAAGEAPATQGTEPVPSMATPYARELDALRAMRDKQGDAITPEDRQFLVTGQLARENKQGGLTILPAGRRRLKMLETELDKRAHEAATSPSNDRPEPTDAQKEAGNYKMGHIRVGPTDISIENPEGSTRSGIGEDGKPWESTLTLHYGYAKGVPARAPDKERVDFMVVPGTPEDYSGPAFIIDQNKADGSFDEPKVVVGAASLEDAKARYLSNYQPGWESRIRGISQVTMDDLNARLNKADAFLAPQPDAQPVSTTGLDTAGKDMADAIIGNLYQQLYDALKAGQDAMAGVKDPVLARARPAFDAGLIKSPEDIRRFENEGYPALQSATQTDDQAADVSQPAIQQQEIPSDQPQQPAEPVSTDEPTEQAQAPSAETTAPIETVTAEPVTAKRKLPAQRREEAAARIPGSERESAATSPHFVAGAKAFKDGEQRVLPSYFTDQKGKNAKAWYRGWDAAKLAAPAEQQQAKKAPTWREIGVNGEGNPLFEDARGVRSYTENGARLTETVGMVPGRGGVSVSINKDDRGVRFSTKEELAAKNDKVEFTVQPLRPGAPAETLTVPKTPRKPVTPQVEALPGTAPLGAKPAEQDAEAKAREDLKAALADLGDILGSGTRKNITPEQEQKLLPVMTRLFDAAFRLGHIKFKQAARFVRDQIRSALGADVADLLTIEHYQGGYISMSGRYKEQGAEKAVEVAAVESLDESSDESPVGTSDETPVEQPAQAERQKDSDGRPIYQKGERVEITDGPYKGRRGAIAVADKIVMRAIGVFGGKQTESTSYAYQVKTDGGATVHVSARELGAEPSNVINTPQDIMFKGELTPPETVYRAIGYARQSARNARESGARARLQSKKTEWRIEAERRDKEAQAAQDAFDAWAERYPLEAQSIRGEPKAATAPATAAPSSAEVAGVKLTLHAGKHGKTGEAIWTVSIDERVPREKYEELKARAQGLGGYYSSFRGRGAIPGFVFKEEAKAREFMGAGTAASSGAPAASGQGPHYAAGFEAFKGGDPRTLPSYFTDQKGRNAADWYRGWDAANNAVTEADIEAMGRQAFLDGKTRVTHGNLNLDKIGKVGTLDAMRAWYRGWDKANVETPVPGVPTPGAAPQNPMAAAAEALRQAANAIEHAVSPTVDTAATQAETDTEAQDAISQPTATEVNDRRGDEAERPADARAPGEREETGPSGVDEGAGGAPAIRRGGERTGPAGDQGDRGGTAGGVPARGAGVESAGEPDSGRGARPSDRVPAGNTGRNYAAPVGALTRKGSWLDTARRNVEIIALVKRLESEGRLATPEEQTLIAQYTGFGASEIANGLFPVKYNYGKKGRRIATQEVDEDAIKPGWKDVYRQLQEVATPEEMATIRRSTQYAHYTSEPVIRSIWSAVEKMGFTGGKILEPGMGTGLFMVAAPKQVANASKYVGIEMDHMTAAIAKQLLQKQNVIRDSYIEHNFPDNFFDLAIGNPPFAGWEVIADPRYRKHRFKLHDYFFAKTIDRVRPGGLLVFVTSAGTMNKLDDAARNYLAERADLLGAIRLPQTAFIANAGTEVVTDVIFLKKRDPNQPVGGQAWAKVDQIEVANENGEKVTVGVNEYFVAHPEMVLGTHSAAGSMYRANSYTVLPQEGDIESHFAKAVENLPADMYEKQAPKKTSVEAQEAANRADFDVKGKKEGGVYVADDGEVMQVRNGVGVPIRSAMGLSDTDLKWLKDYVPVRDALKQALSDQLTDGPWQDSQAALNKAYKAFVKKWGRLQEHTITERTVETNDGESHTYKYKRFKYGKLLKSNVDAEVTLALGLEKINEDNTDIEDGDILSKRVLDKPAPPQINSVKDALFVHLNETGQFDLDAIAERMGMERESAIAELGEMIYEDPAASWQLADEYLSGDVVKKFEEAQLAAETDSRYQRNVEALAKVQPAPLGPQDIEVRLGANWVPASDVQAFTAEMLDVARKIDYDIRSNTWSVEGESLRSERGESKWGTLRRSSGEILSAILNNRDITVRDTTVDKKTVVNKEQTAAANAVADKMREAFKSWIWTDAARASRILKDYNRRFNNLAPRNFDGSYLTLPGLSMRWRPYPHQLRAIARILQTGNTYLAHAVGAGKTMEMIISGMEQKRLGLIKRPIYVVPNHMLEQFANEFMEFYPAARVLIADKENFVGDERRRFVAKAALGDWDAVVIKQSSFKLIGTKAETRAAVADEFIKELEAALDDVDTSDRTTRKRLEAQIEAFKQRVEKAGGGDKNITFEEMGIDFLYIDEAHTYRKLDFSTNRQVKGVTPEGSLAAFDLFVKARHLERLRRGRSIVLASGTPVTNTMAEVYTVQRFMDYDTLVEDGLHHFDAWANSFGIVVAEWERNAAGNYEKIERFAKFINVPELMMRVRKFMDVLTMEQLGTLVDRPVMKGGKPQMMTTQKSKELDDYMRGELAQRITISKKWKPSREEKGNPDPIINIITDGRLSAIDMRFVHPGMRDDKGSKLNLMIDNIISDYKATQGNAYTDPDTKQPDKLKGGSHIVFSAVGFGEQVAKNRGFDPKAWMLKRFKAAGIPSSEVAFMSDFKTDSQKEAMFREMREGRKRILVGSPQNMGTGLNVQKRLASLHFLSPPWYPADIEQPHGRILRQGNQNAEVDIRWYVTEGTYDSSQWGMVRRKGRMIEQSFAGEKSVRAVEDISEVGQYAMAEAIASGDNRVIQLAEMKADIERFELLRGAHFQEQSQLHSKKSWTTHSLKTARENLKKAEGAIEAVGEDYRSWAPVEIQIGGATYDRPSDAGKAVLEEIKKIFDDDAAYAASRKKFDLGTVRGKHKIVAEYFPGKKKDPPEVEVNVQIGDMRVGVQYREHAVRWAAFDATGLGQRIRHTLDQPEKLKRESEASIEQDERALKQINSRLGAPFEYEQQLAQRIADAAALENDLTSEGKKAEEIQKAAEELKQQQEDDAQAKISGARFYIDAAGNAKVAKNPEDAAIGLVPGESFFVFEISEGNWSFTHAGTGGRVATGETKEEAIQNANEVAERIGTERFMQTLDKSPKLTDEQKQRALDGDTAFSRSPFLGAAVSMRDAQAVVANIRRALPGAPPIHLHEKLSQAPKALQQLIRSRGAEADVEAAFHEGEVHVFPANIATVERMEFVVGHHELRHYGLRAMLGPRVDGLMLTLYAGNETLKREANKLIKQGIAKSRTEAVEEVLADLPVEEMKRLKGFNRLVADIRDALRKLAVKFRNAGLKALADLIEPKEWTDNDVIALVQRAEEISLRGDTPFRAGGSALMTAYHGSPHDFERFDISKIGTGEGARARGWGMYFGEAREVGEHYRSTLRKPEIHLDGAPIGSAAELERKIGKTGAQALSELREQIDTTARALTLAEAINLVTDRTHANWLRANRRRIEAPTMREGRLYQVNLAPAEDEYLLWDKPLSQQSEKVRTALATGKHKVIGEALDRDWQGGKFYRELSQALGEFGQGDADASQYLHSLGVPGIKYLDGSSRGRGEGSYNYVLFSDKLVSIEARFSRALASRAREEVGNLFESQRTFNRWWHRTVGTQFHKAKIDRHFRRVFDLGQDYLTDTSRYAMMAEAEAPDLLLRMEGVRDLLKRGIPAKDKEALAKPIFQGTLDEVTYTDDQLRDEFGLNDRQVAHYRQFRAAVDRSLDELAKSTLAKMAKGIGIRMDSVMQYRDMPIDQFHREVNDLMRERARVLRQLADELDDDDKSKPLRMAQAEEAATQARQAVELYNHVQKLKKEGYAPLMRFGEYTVYVTQEGEDGPEQVFFGMYESQREANAAAKALTEEYPDAEITQGVMSKEAWRVFNGLSPDTVEIFAKAAGLDQEPLFQQYLRLAVNNRSALKRLIHRKGVPGFSQDVTRVLASFVTSNARLTSSNYHLGEMQGAVEAIPKEKGDVKDEAVKLWKYLTDPQEEAGAVRGFLFFQFLGGSIASALVNATQPITMTAPYLAKFASSAKVAAELSKATMEAAKNVPGADVRQAYERAVQDGIVAPHEIYQLMAQARGNVMGSTGIGRAMKVWGAFFSLAEAFNRRATFLAAYRIAVANNEANPYEFAKEAVYETQGLYNKGNRPDWARGAAGATIFTFKQFSIAYVEFLKRLHDTNKPAFWLAIAILGMAGGAEGMPFAEDIQDIIDTIGQWLGYSTNSKKWLHKRAAQVFGEGGAQFVLHGVSGIPGVPLDISARMGMHNLIPGTAALKRSEADKGREALEVIGPVGGVVQNVGRGLEAAAKGDFGRAAKAILPLAVQNLFKGAEMWEKGYYTDTRGRRVKDTTGGEAILKAAGFQPASVASESRKIQAARQDIELHRVTESGIADKWARGVVDKRPELINEARAELKRWNQQNPDQRIRLIPSQIRRRVVEMRKTREQRFIKTAPPEIRRQVATDLR